MTLVEYDTQKFLKAIKRLEAHIPSEEDPRERKYLCCRNCLNVNNEVYRCLGCKLDRCKRCAPIHGRIKNFLAVYGFLELGLSHTIMEHLLARYRDGVERCEQCYSTYCLDCKKMRKCEKCNYLFCPDKCLTLYEDKWLCEDCVDDRRIHSEED